MSKKIHRNRSLIGLPITVDFAGVKTEERKILEFDPNKIKKGQLIIVKVSKFMGFSNAVFAVLNVDGKNVVIKQLKDKQHT
jgi:hypothetical protein